MWQFAVLCGVLVAGGVAIGMLRAAFVAARRLGHGVVLIVWGFYARSVAVAEGRKASPA